MLLKFVIVLSEKFNVYYKKILKLVRLHCKKGKYWYENINCGT